MFYQLCCLAAIEAAVTVQVLTAQEDIVNQFEIATALLDTTYAHMLEPAGGALPRAKARTQDVLRGLGAFWVVGMGEPEPEVNQY